MRKIDKSPLSEKLDNKAINGRFSPLFTPARIGPMSLKNRLVMPPMTTQWATGEGYVTEKMKDYYAERAGSGVALVIVESTCVDTASGRLAPRQLNIDDDRFIPGLSGLARAIKEKDCRASIQLNHGGRDVQPPAGTGATNSPFRPVSASAIVTPGGRMSRALDIPEIKVIIQRFAKAALRAKKAGFDGVEIHGAHSYLLASFLSPHYNRRQDEYGGDLKDRARFLLETIAAVRAQVGQEYPVWCRLNGFEYGIEDGITLEEAGRVARMAQEAGADAIHMTAFGTTNNPLRTGARPSVPGSQVPFAEGAKKMVSIPVIAVGRISLELGAKVIQEKKADLIAIGRALLSDPEFIKKSVSGRTDDIAPCIACNACLYVLSKEQGLRCTVNASVGREQEYRIKAAKKGRKVLIIGAGAAGMEAARIAASRGHHVVLLERRPGPGGQLIPAAIPPRKEEIKKLKGFLSKQLERPGVKVELETEFTPALLERYKPDVVIVAAGARPIVPRISGIDRENVVTAEDILAGKADTGDKYVILGGGQVGCETAEYLSEKGKKDIAIVEMLERLAADTTERQGERILMNVRAAKGVSIMTGTKGEEISDRGLVVTDNDGQRRTIEADIIVLACGYRPDTGLIEELKDIAAEVYLAGDCIWPRTIMEAIADGSRIGRLI